MFHPIFPYGFTMKGLPMKPSIVIRIGAAHHDMVITERGSSQRIDLSKLSRSEARKVRRMTVSALDRVGYFAAAA